MKSFKLPSRVPYLRDVEDVTLEPVWSDHLYPEFGFVFGPKEIGKGLFAMRVAADLTRRGERVWFLSREDSEGTLKARATVAGADLDLLAWEGDLDLRLPEDIDRVEAEIIANDFRLVVLDVLGSYAELGAKERAWAQLLQAVAVRQRVCILGLSHPRKHLDPQQSVLDQALGVSGGFAAVARWGYFIGNGPVDSQARVLVKVKGNNFGDVLPLLYTIGVSDYVASDGNVREVAFYEPGGSAPGVTDSQVLAATVRAAGIHGNTDGPAVEEAKRWLVRYLTTSANFTAPVTHMTAMAKLDGISEITLRRARSRLEAEKSIKRETQGRAHFLVLARELAEQFESHPDPTGDDG